MSVVSPAFLPPFPFLRVVPKQRADTLLHGSKQLISRCACILTSGKSRTQFSVIFCSVQFQKGPLLCIAISYKTSFLYSLLSAPASFICFTFISSSTFSSFYPHHLWSASLSFLPIFNFLHWTGNFFYDIFFRGKSQNPRFALLHLIFQFGLNNNKHLIIILTPGNLDTRVFWIEVTARHLVSATAVCILN